MSSARVRHEVVDGVLHIVLDAPERGNAMDLEFADALQDALGLVDESVRCVLLRATGPNFCVGGDIATFDGDDLGATIRSLADRLHVGLRALAAVEVPVVAAVQGWAAGAGMSLALAADLLVMGRGARMRTAYNRLGLTADGGMTWHLPRRLPRAVAMDLLLTDRALDADEAERLGLASRVVADDELEASATALARDLAWRSRPAAAAVKQLVGHSPVTGLSDQLEAEAAAMETAARGDDVREGIAAFRERRDPRFA